MRHELKLMTENLKSCEDLAQQWEQIVLTYLQIANDSCHVNDTDTYDYLYSKMTTLARKDLHIAALYLLYLCRNGSVNERMANKGYFSAVGAGETCVNQLYKETNDPFLCLVIGVGYMEGSITLPLAFKDATTAFLSAVKDAKDACCREAEQMDRFLKDYLPLRNDIFNAAWKGNKEKMEFHLSELEDMYLLHQEDMLFNFITKDFISNYNLCRQYRKEKRACLRCLAIYPNDTKARLNLQTAKKKCFSPLNLIKWIPLLLLLGIRFGLLPLIIFFGIIHAFNSIIAAGILAGIVLVVSVGITFSSEDRRRGIDDFIDGFLFGQFL